MENSGGCRRLSPVQSQLLSHRPHPVHRQDRTIHLGRPPVFDKSVAPPIGSKLYYRTHHFHLQVEGIPVDPHLHVRSLVRIRFPREQIERLGIGAPLLLVDVADPTLVRVGEDLLIFRQELHSEDARSHFSLPGVRLRRDAHSPAAVAAVRIDREIDPKIVEIAFPLMVDDLLGHVPHAPAVDALTFVDDRLFHFDPAGSPVDSRPPFEAQIGSLPALNRAGNRNRNRIGRGLVNDTLVFSKVQNRRRRPSPAILRRWPDLVAAVVVPG